MDLINSFIDSFFSSALVLFYLFLINTTLFIVQKNILKKNAKSFKRKVELFV